MSEIIKNWNWDLYHIGAVIFLFMVAGAIAWIVIDSINYKKKVNGKR
jgi:hypothetical protein